VARFYLDENVSNGIVEPWRAAGHRVLSTDAARRKGGSDVRQLLFASYEARIMVTYDLGHFSLVHEAWIAFNPTRQRHAAVSWLAGKPPSRDGWA